MASSSQYAPPAGRPPSYYSSSTPKASSSGIHLSRDADLLIQSFLPPEAPHSQPPQPNAKLPLPYCVPQLRPGFDAPFARGYSPLLEECAGISQEELLAFVDGLNLAMTASPPLRVVNLAGMVVGFVPYHWAMLAGFAMQASAQASMRVLSKTLTDRYLRAANKRLFHPRGLSARICTAPALAHLVLGTPLPLAAAQGELRRIDKFGRAVGGLLMRLPTPLTSAVVHRVADAPPPIAPIQNPDPASYDRARMKPTMLATQRRVAALHGYALPVTFDGMPKPAKAEGVMDTMSAWGVKFDAWRDGRKQGKAEEKRVQLARMEMEMEMGVGGGRQDERQQRGGPSRGGGLLSQGIAYLSDRANAGSREQERYAYGRRGGSGGLERRLLTRDRSRDRPRDGPVGLVLGLVAKKLSESGSRSTPPAPYGGYSNDSNYGNAPAPYGSSNNNNNSYNYPPAPSTSSARGLLSDLRRGGVGELKLQVKDADLQEHWNSAKLLWVVIMNSDMDAEIEGIERAESGEDEECVDEATWRAEMGVELEEMQFEREVEKVAAAAQDSQGEKR